MITPPPGQPQFTPEALRDLIGPNLISSISDSAYQRLAEYVALLYRWNSRMNLTAVRDPQSLATFHLAESIRSAQILPPQGIRTVLDFGSGAGLPGIPVAITRPDLQITLLEAQSKKAMFLREACRTLGLQNTAVLRGRAESMDPTLTFDAVMLRAVEHMQQALHHARARLNDPGWLILLISAADLPKWKAELQDVRWMVPVLVAGSSQRMIVGGQTGRG
ncbi:MAG TPA: 16S rRNA (guanine(527)-N(7))-methyltransferase RsmG [Acidobacteriaceae bacterium]|nr:16S rRNA (guanine(527)-N(7))-methyltransferase RsmG [Acidobacteriaceae bacterium]